MAKQTNPAIAPIGKRAAKITAGAKPAGRKANAASFALIPAAKSAAFISMVAALNAEVKTAKDAKIKKIEARFIHAALAAWDVLGRGTAPTSADIQASFLTSIPTETKKAMGINPNSIRHWADPLSHFMREIDERKKGLRIVPDKEIAELGKNAADTARTNRAQIGHFHAAITSLRYGCTPEEAKAAWLNITAALTVLGVTSYEAFIRNINGGKGTAGAYESVAAKKAREAKEAGEADGDDEDEAPASAAATQSRGVMEPAAIENTNQFSMVYAKTVDVLIMKDRTKALKWLESFVRRVAGDITTLRDAIANGWTKPTAAGAEPASIPAPATSGEKRRIASTTARLVTRKSAQRAAEASPHKGNVTAIAVAMDAAKRKAAKPRTARR